MIRRIFISLCLLCATLIGAFFYLLDRDWVDFSALERYGLAQSSVVLDDDGQEITRFELDRRDPITFDKLPDILVKAFVATEDHNFFTHSGFSLRGILRSFFVNLYHFRTVQGGSTITQQLARLIFLSHERTYYRKLKEVFLAFQIERQFSKQQILELYLNNIYFGRGIYGVEAACRRFWNKSLDQISLDQAAILASVAASARLYSPLNAPANAKRRRDIILRSMVKQGFITQKASELAIKQKVEVQDYIRGNPIRLYVQEWVRAWAEQQWGKEALYCNGLKIKTTLNLETQTQAEKSFSSVIQKLRAQRGNSLNGGMLAIDSMSGAIKAMIGGVDFRESQYNRAMQAYRQMGSSFKPILFALATKAGIEMDSVFTDEPLAIKLENGTIWEPRNWDNKHMGSMTLARALTLSRNSIAVQVFLKLGGGYVIPWAKMFGIHRALQNYPSLALGTAEATVLENVAAFNVFANNGTYVKPYCIEWVKDAHGAKIWEHEPEGHRVMDSRLNSKMVNMLSHRMSVGRRTYGAAWIDADSIGKTGSTNGAVTTWFVGATPELTTAVYVGHDDNRPLEMYATSTALPIWLAFNKAIPCKKKHFYIDPSLHEVSIDWYTGKPSNDLSDPGVIKILR